MTPLTDAQIIARVTVRLQDRLPHVPSERVGEVVVSVVAGFRGSKVPDFLPVLVEREALKVLRNASDHDAA